MDEMVDSRKEAVERIQDRIARGEYRVDAAAVAEAIVKRLLDGGTTVGPK